MSALMDKILFTDITVQGERSWCTDEYKGNQKDNGNCDSAVSLRSGNDSIWKWSAQSRNGLRDSKTNIPSISRRSFSIRKLQPIMQA